MAIYFKAILNYSFFWYVKFRGFCLSVRWPYFTSNWKHMLFLVYKNKGFVWLTIHIIHTISSKHTTLEFFLWSFRNKQNILHISDWWIKGMFSFLEKEKEREKYWLRQNSNKHSFKFSTQMSCSMYVSFRVLEKSAGEKFTDSTDNYFFPFM